MFSLNLSNGFAKICQDHEKQFRSYFGGRTSRVKNTNFNLNAYVEQCPSFCLALTYRYRSLCSSTGCVFVKFSLTISKSMETYCYTPSIKEIIQYSFLIWNSKGMICCQFTDFISWVITLNSYFNRHSYQEAAQMVSMVE